MKKMLTDILEKVVLPRFITSNTSLSDLMSLDLDDDNIYRSAKNVKVNFSTKEALAEVNTSEQDEIAFKVDVKACIRSLVEKLRERSNIQHKIVSHLDCLNPKTIRERSTATLTKKMDGCLL